MSDDMVKGFFLKTPKDTAPDFVKRKVSVNVEQFLEYLQANVNESGFVNFDLNEARSGHWYLKLDTWKPENQQNVNTGNNSVNSANKGFNSFKPGGQNNKPSYENYPSGQPKDGGGNFEDDIPF